MPLLTVALLAAPPAPLAPSAPWNVEAQADMCILSRQYGPPEAQALLAFQPIPGQGSMDLIVVTPARSRMQDTGEATVTRLPDGRIFKGSFVRLTTSDGKRTVVRVSLDRALFDELGDASELQVKARTWQTRLTIGPSVKARAAYADCDRDLLASWGTDPVAAFGPNRTQPPRDLQRYFLESSYPAAARDAGFIGRVTAVLNIDATGRVSQCRAVVGAGKLLTDATCSNAMKLPFTPARDAAGKPAPGVFVLRVRWKMGPQEFWFL